MFPSRTATGTWDWTDYEYYSYDAVGNRTYFRKRDGSWMTFQYDQLNRMILKVVPERAGLAATHTRDRNSALLELGTIAMKLFKT